MVHIDYRSRAGRHYAAARGLLEKGDDSRLLHACLELRLTIECLAYDILQLFRADLPEEIVQTWQADKVLRAIAEFDPGADGTIQIEIEGEPGQPPIELIDHRMTSAWASKAYPQLGSFLHERTLLQIEGGNDLDGMLVRDRASRIADELDAIVNSTAFHFRIIQRVTFECDCSAPVVAQLGSFQASAYGRCERCSVRFQVRPIEPGNLAAGLRTRRLGPGELT